MYIFITAQQYITNNSNSCKGKWPVWNFQQQFTRKRGKAQRVARPACANAIVHFVFTKIGCATATQRMTFKN